MQRQRVADYMSHLDIRKENSRLELIKKDRSLIQFGIRVVLHYMV